MRFLFRYAQAKGGFNLFLEILNTKYPLRLGGLPDSCKQLGIDACPKQVLVSGLLLRRSLSIAALAEFDAETRFRVRVARGNPEAGMRLLDRLDKAGRHPHE